MPSNSRLIDSTSGDSTVNLLAKHSIDQDCPLRVHNAPNRCHPLGRAEQAGDRVQHVDANVGQRSHTLAVEHLRIAGVLPPGSRAHPADVGLDGVGMTEVAVLDPLLELDHPGGGRRGRRHEEVKTLVPGDGGQLAGLLEGDAIGFSRVHVVPASSARAVMSRCSGAGVRLNTRSIPPSCARNSS